MFHKIKRFIIKSKSADILAEELEKVLNICELQGNFENGNVFNGMDEGQVFADKYICGAKCRLTEYKRLCGYE